MHAWPAEIGSEITARAGSDPTVQRLGGMGGSEVVRLEGARGSIVLKSGSNPVETHVYTTLADLLRANEVALPELYASCFHDDIYWLLLEDIPHPFPRQRWEADEEQLGMLRRLHTITPPPDLPDPDAYRPEWPQDMTASVLSLFPRDTAVTLATQLESIRDASKQLFQPDCLISGDPNPANWGMRGDGTLVLFDWERCTLGTPAIDLAITVPGLGEQSVFERVSTIYSGTSDLQLARDIALLKVWSVTEFLAQYAQATVVPAFPIEPLLEKFPEWLDSIGNLPGGNG